MKSVFRPAAPRLPELQLHRPLLCPAGALGPGRPGRRPLLLGPRPLGRGWILAILLGLGVTASGGRLAWVRVPGLHVAALRADEAEDREAALVFNTASRFYRQKNWRDAAQAFGEFLRKFPGHRDAPEARFASGYSLNRAGDHVAAVEMLRLAARDEGTPWAGEAHFYLGRSLEALGKGAESSKEERARRLTQAAESYGKAAQLYAAIARGEGPAAGSAGGEKPEKPEKPEEERARGLDLEVLALGAQGEALYDAESFAEAARSLEPLLKERKALSPSQHYHRAVYVLGLARQSLESQSSQKADAAYAGAREALRVAAEASYAREPLWEEAAFLLGRLAHQAGDHAEADAAYDLVVKAGGGRAAEALYYKGVALYESHDAARLPQARADLTRFLRENKGHALAARARYHEALCAFDLKDFTAAQGEFEAVAKESPELRGRALLRRGQSLLLQPDPLPGQAAACLAEGTQALEEDGKSADASSARDARRWLAEAWYWKGEAHLAEKDKLPEAADAYARVFARFAQDVPELAENALYQEARTLYLAGQHLESARASELYRATYSAQSGRYFAESLLLSAECAFRAPEGSVPEALRGQAARLYEQAAAALKSPEEARRARYLAGVALYFQKEPAAAAERLEAVYQETAQLSPAPFPELNFYLADALAQQSEEGSVDAEARARWRRSIELYDEYLARSTGGSHIPNALINLALCQGWINDRAGAQRTLERFLELFPQHALGAQVRFELGNTKLLLGDLEGAVLAYASAAEAGSAEGPLLDAVPLAARALYQKALLERRIGKPVEAEKTIASLLEGYGEALRGNDGGQRLEADARYQRSLSLLESGKGDEARAALAEYLALPGAANEAEARAQLARSQLDAGRPDDALAALEPLLQAPAGAAGRDQALYLSAWAHAAIAEKSSDADAARHRGEVEALYRKLIAEFPQGAFTVDAMLELGQHLFNRKAYAESRRWLETVRTALEADSVPIDRESAERSRDLLERSIYGLAFLDVEEGKQLEAAKLFDRVALREEGPLAPRSVFQAARAYLRAGAVSEARDRFQRLADEWKDRAGDLHEECLLRLSECAHQLQKYDEAKTAAERLLAEHPGGELVHEARFAKGHALQFSGDLDGAVEAYRAVVAGTRQPVAARAQYQIGESRHEQKRYRDAAKEFVTVVANFDFDGEYRPWVRRSLLHAGISFQEAGDNDAARQQLKELTDRFGDSEEAKAAAERLRSITQ